MAEKIDIEVSRNEDHNKLLVSALNSRLKKVYLGGGEKRIAKLKADGKLNKDLQMEETILYIRQFQATVIA